MTDPSRLRWSERDRPLPVAGVLLAGRQVSAFAQRLLEPGVDLREVRLATAGEYLVAVGDEESVPWVDEAIWLGRDGSILCPALLQPDLPVDLIARSLTQPRPARGLVVIVPGIAFVSEVPAGPPGLDQLRRLAGRLSEQT